MSDRTSILYGCDDKNNSLHIYRNGETQQTEVSIELPGTNVIILIPIPESLAEDIVNELRMT